MYKLEVSRYAVKWNGRQIGVIIPVADGWQFISQEYPFDYRPAKTPGLALSYFIDQKEA